MANISLNIPTEPVPKLRPRFSVIRGRVHTHTPYKTKEYENRIAAAYLEKSKGFKFDKNVPLDVQIVFGMPIPKSTTKKKRTDMINGLYGHTVKPDCDNLAKAILDALNGIAWHDDAQITHLNVSKSYAESPYIYIYVSDMY